MDCVGIWENAEALPQNLLTVHILMDVTDRMVLV
jgi:hypothetical protein